MCDLTTLENMLVKVSSTYKAFHCDRRIKRP